MKIKKIKKVAFFLANTIMVVILMIGLLIALSFLPIENNYKLYSVMSGSMEPQIPTGSLAVVLPTKSYKAGDIITFISQGATSDKETTTHRIVNVAQDGNQRIYTTKGDANENNDAKPVANNRVIGEYIFGIALLGYLMKYLTTLTGLIILILLPALFIIIEEIIAIIGEVKKIRNNRLILRRSK